MLVGSLSFPFLFYFFGLNCNVSDGGYHINNVESARMDEWLQRHLIHLCEAYVRADEQLKQAAARKERCDGLSRSIPLQVGEVIRKRVHLIGMSKTTDIWSEDPLRRRKRHKQWHTHLENIIQKDY